MSTAIGRFNQEIWAYYRIDKRHFPWRETINPYHLLVSEVMLQQTQTGRVVSYYERFLEHFPTIEKLAAASQVELLKVWQGLGYNRRALFLKRTAAIIVKNFAGQVPTTTQELVGLPGIGQHTAGAILAYAYNQPSIFIETNIRKTIIHFFFTKQPKVHDSEITAILKKVVDKNNPREWYWAVVDYGSMLGQKKLVTNVRSRHYHPQSQFVGSKRFYRSQILQKVLEKPLEVKELEALFPHEPALIKQALKELLAEKFITQHGQKLLIA